jgi:hypothetical protein
VLGYVYFYALNTGWDAVPDFYFFRFSDNLSYSASNLCFLIFNLTPTLDALITLRVVKQYRTAFNDVAAKIFRRNNTVDVLKIGKQPESTPVTSRKKRKTIINH